MIELGGFTISPGTRFRSHEHETTHVVVVLTGGFIERERSGWRDVGPGTVRVSGAARHDVDFGRAGARCLVLEVEEGVLEPPASPRFLVGVDPLAALARRLDAAVSTNDPTGRYGAIDLTSELLAQIARRLGGRASPPPPWLAEIRELLHDTEGAASVSDLVALASVHRVTLARVFREHLGVTVTGYARRLRLAAAGRALADGDPPARAAARAGFADQSHLTRSMRAAWGTTPGAFRRTLHPFKTDVSAKRELPA